MNTFTAVIKEYEDRYGAKKVRVDENETFSKLVKNLEQAGYTGVNEYGDGFSFPISVSVVRKHGQYMGSKQFRIYFKGYYWDRSSRGPKKFVQSDTDGNLDWDKFVTKYAEHEAQYIKSVQVHKEIESKESENEKFAEQLTKQLKGTGFEINYSRGGFKATSSCYASTDVQNLVNLIVKLQALK